MPIKESSLASDIDALGEERPSERAEGGGNLRTTPAKIDTVIIPSFSEKEEDDPKPRRRPERESRTERPTDEEEEETDEEPEEGKPRKRSNEMTEALRELAESQKALTEVTTRREREAAQPRLTPEEVRKRLNVFEPDPAFVRDLLGLPEDALPETIQKRMALFNQLRDGLTKQAFTAAQLTFQQELSKRDTQLQELERFRQQEESKAIRRDFNELYPTFKSKKYDKILRICAGEMEGQSFRDNDSYFHALAKNAAEALRDLDPDFELSESEETQPKRQSQSNGNRPRLPRSGGGGGGGASRDRQPASTAERNDVDSLR